jgi:hypothetical protein
LAEEVGPVLCISVDEVISAYRGPKKARYEQAYLDYLDSGLEERDFRCTGFVKFEQLKGSKINRAPRIIQFPSFKVILLFMQFVRPFEARLKELEDEFGTRIFFKGLSPERRAEEILRKWDSFRDPVVVLMDCTGWDVHCSAEQLILRRRSYGLLTEDPVVLRIADKQCNTDTKTKKGVRAKRDGGVCSGRADTGAGNSFDCVALTRHAFSEVGITKYSVANDGDDEHVYIEREDVPKLSGLVDQFRKYGHELKIEGVVDEVHEIDFCQARLVHVHSGPIMVRNPMKILSNGLCTNKFVSAKSQRRFVRSCGLCELSLNRGVPILQAYAMALLRNTDGVESLPEWEIESIQHRASGRSLEVFTYPISEATRHSFELAWGFTAGEQFEIENRLSRWVIRFGEPSDGTEAFLPASWVGSYGTETVFC